MVLLTTTKRLEDDAAVQRRNRRSWLLSWTTSTVINIINRAVRMAEDDVFAASEQQVSDLRKELDDAGLLELMPMEFGSAKASRFTSDTSFGKNKGKSKSKKSRKNKKNRNTLQATTTTTNIEKEVASITDIDEIIIGGEYLCFYNGDCLWYPAIIQKCDEQGWFRVKFVGYGNEEIIPITWIKEAPQTNQFCTSEVMVEEQPRGNAKKNENIMDQSTDYPRTVETNHDACINLQTNKTEELCREENEEFGNVVNDMEDWQEISVVTDGPKKKLHKFANWSCEDAPNPFPHVDDKYWAQRYRLFSRYDEGILLDDESWFSATPEVISQHIANRCRCDVILDPFCGVGGNVIQFAFTCHRVIAIDIDPLKIEKARNNAKIYGVEDRIEFIVGDSLKIMSTMVQGNRHGLIDMVYLSPPWGGPSYLHAEVFDIESMIHLTDSCNGTNLFQVARQLSKHVAYFLPRNISPKQLNDLADAEETCEIEDHVLNNKLKTRVAYYGELASKE